MHKIPFSEEELTIDVLSRFLWDELVFIPVSYKNLYMRSVFNVVVHNVTSLLSQRIITPNKLKLLLKPT